jgi:hypothetical protein
VQALGLYNNGFALTQDRDVAEMAKPPDESHYWSVWIKKTSLLSVFLTQGADFLG